MRVRYQDWPPDEEEAPWPVASVLPSPSLGDVVYSQHLSKTIWTQPSKSPKFRRIKQWLSSILCLVCCPAARKDSAQSCRSRNAQCMETIIWFKLRWQVSSSRRHWIIPRDALIERKWDARSTGLPEKSKGGAWRIDNI